MKIKNSFYIMTVLFIFVMVACSEDFIDKPIEPGTQSDVSFRRTPDGLLYTLNASYAFLKGQYWHEYPVNKMILGNYRSDDSQAGGEDENDGIPEYAINDFNIFSTNRVVSEFWRPCYTAIHYANAVIESAPTALEIAQGSDIALINNYVGQAKCLRAYWYFELVREFGAIPLVLSSSIELIPRSSFSAVYDQIESDAIQASLVLPKANELSSENKGRMNSGSALAILAKVYLFRASLEPVKADFYYEKAFETAKAVIESGQFSLLSSYDKVWKHSGDFSSEGIVEGGNPAPGNTTTEVSVFGIAQSPRYFFTSAMEKGPASAYGWGKNIPTHDFAEAFEAGDPRKHWSIYSQGDSSNAGVKNQSKYQLICFDHNATGYYLRKYDPDGFPIGGNKLNIKYYRYSDLLLVGAEAANEINEVAYALDWLEKVRSRARNTSPAPYHEIDHIEGAPVIITTTDKNELRNIIRNERRVELGLEGHRFYDLVRWDGNNGFNWKTTVEAAQAKVGPDYQISNTSKSGLPRKAHIVIVEDKHKLSPIPDDEIRSSSNTLTQNPGY